METSHHTRGEVRNTSNLEKLQGSIGNSETRVSDRVKKGK